MSLPAWRILADDLTGALDSAAAFCAGTQVPVFLHTPPPGTADAAGTQAWATGSRDVPVGDLPALLQVCLPWLVGSSAAPVMSFKKVDSLVRGNTFAEVAWLARAGAFEGVVFAPGYPGQGRFTRGGQHWTRTDTQPMDLVAAFAAQGVTAQAVPCITGPLAAQSGIVIPDVADDAALQGLYALWRAEPEVARRWLWCGSAGLAGVLAQVAVAPQARAPAGNTARPALARGPVCLVTASRHPVLRQQLQALPPLGTRGLLRDLASPQPLAAAQAQTQLMQHAHQLVRTLPRPEPLVVVGGDTLLALCQASGAHTLQAHASPRPGWGLARFQGGLWDGITCFSRSGAFGPPDDLAALLDTLFDTFVQKETAP